MPDWLDMVGILLVLALWIILIFWDVGNGNGNGNGKNG